MSINLRIVIIFVWHTQILWNNLRICHIKPPSTRQIIIQLKHFSLESFKKIKMCDVRTSSSYLFLEYFLKYQIQNAEWYWLIWDDVGFTALENIQKYSWMKLTFITENIQLEPANIEFFTRQFYPKFACGESVKKFTQMFWKHYDSCNILWCSYLYMVYLMLPTDVLIKRVHYEKFHNIWD